MHRSDIIEVRGVFVGAALVRPREADRMFVAAHADVRALNGVRGADVNALHRIASELYDAAQRNRANNEGGSP